MVWGESASFAYDSGHAVQIADWNLCPGDTRGLLAKVGRWFGLPYSAETIHLAGFHGDPARMPVLLFNGGRRLRLDDAQLAQLGS